MTSELPVAILFDVFGTVVDWREGIIRAGRALPDPGAGTLDWGAFADDWRREGYLEPIAQIVAGRRPFAPVEVLLAEALAGLVERYGIDIAGERRDQLLGAWRRLDPWPDAASGLERLRQQFLVAPLSNGSFAQLTEMAKRAGLRWDCIISTELFGTYKPDPSAYRGALDLLGLAPSEAMLVAAHPGDLRAAAACGLRTAYVPRPSEWGPPSAPPPPYRDAEVVAPDLQALADQLIGRAQARVRRSP